MIYRKPATRASGSVTFNGSAGVTIPAGTALVRSDGYTATTTADLTVVGTTAVAAVLMDADSTGLTGAYGNAAVGVVMTLSQAISGIQAGGAVSVEFTGGADIETDDALRSRMLVKYQSSPQGGAQADYVEWAEDVSGVTRAWCVPNGAGTGTVVVYVMLDVSNAAYNGFPQGTNGAAAGETRAVAATGDQLTVANYIFPLRPVTALVYVMAPVAAPVVFTITGIAAASRAAVTVAIAAVLLLYGTAVGGSIPIAYVWSAVAAVSGITDFVISTPSGDITNIVGTLPTVGVITW